MTIQLKGPESEVTLTVEIKRATGEVETLELVGHIINEEHLEEPDQKFTLFSR